jgi:hypothetical protein
MKTCPNLYETVMIEASPFTYLHTLPSHHCLHHLALQAAAHLRIIIDQDKKSQAACDETTSFVCYGMVETPETMLL